MSSEDGVLTSRLKPVVEFGMVRRSTAVDLRGTVRLAADDDLFSTDEEWNFSL